MEKFWIKCNDVEWNFSGKNGVLLAPCPVYVPCFQASNYIKMHYCQWFWRFPCSQLWIHVKFQLIFLNLCCWEIPNNIDYGAMRLWSKSSLHGSLSLLSVFNAVTFSCGGRIVSVCENGFPNSKTSEMEQPWHFCLLVEKIEWNMSWKLSDRDAVP